MMMGYGLKHDGDDDRQEIWARVLKARYGEVAQEPIPDRFRELLKQLEDADSHDR